jgi:ferritin-like metal-binding protein YciE
MNASEKVARYLTEAKASEDALVRVLQSQIAMTPSGAYRTALDRHLKETRTHSQRVSDRIGELSGRPNPLRFVVGLAEEAAGQTLALAKTPLDLLRGSGGEEKVLKNAKDAAATEALEIATYTAIEQLASAVGDEKTAKLARSIRDDEQAMLDRILELVPGLTDAVVRAELRDDPSYDVTRTGAADAVKRAGREVQDTAKSTASATRRTARTARKVPGVAQAEGQVKGAVASESDLAIRGYDSLTADEINAKLPELSQIDLAKLDSYERRHENRTTVLSRIDGLRGDEPWPGFDELTVSEVAKALSTQTDDQVRAVREYESRHKGRAGVINATERQLA